METHKRLALSCLLSVVCLALSGQPMEGDFGDGVAERIGYEADVATDLSLFYIPLESSYDLFSQLSEFNFSAVRYDRRGYEGRYAGSYVNGIDLNDPLSGRMNYHILGALRRTSLRPGYDTGLGAAERLLGGLCGIAAWSVRPSEARTGHRATVYASDRRYRWGVRASSAGTLNANGWHYAVSASRRWGRDGHIEGVFTDETQAAVALEKQFAKGHSITFFAMAAPTKQGLRSAATQEAFSLTGNPLYNPSWGEWDGAEVNAKVREQFQPLFLVSYAGRIGEKTEVEASLAALTGRSAYSALRWYRADNPYPDYYRKLPGFVGEHQPEAYDDLSAAWRASDPAWTQIAWDRLVAANRIRNEGGEPAAYVIENRVTQGRNLQLAASLTHRIDDRLRVSGGIRIRRDHARHFKEAKNLLGGAFLLDVDEFLVGDEYYGGRVQNDVRHPDRRVRAGERFGYDYAMRLDQWGASAQVHYRDRRFSLSAGAEGASVALWRDGRYEKEMYPGAGSFGKSGRIALVTYTAKVTAGYALSPRHSVGATVMVGDAAPAYEQLFLSPRYRNEAVPRPEAIGLMAAEVDYRLALGAVRMKLCGFWTRSAHESEVYQYYDDLEDVYSDMVVTGLDKLRYGVELGAEVRLTPRLYLNVAASAAHYAYASDPRVDVFSDVDGHGYVSGSKSSLRGYRIGPTPQRVASVELKYSGTKGWYATAAWSYMGDSHAGVNPLRRMPRVLALAGSEEAFDRFARQERLPAAALLNLFVSKSLRVGRHTLSLTGSVSNLLGRTNIVYSAYEPMRLERIGEGVNATRRPFANKYLYGYGRTYYAAVGYRF